MLSLSDVLSAAHRLKGHIVRTPLVESPALSALMGVAVFLKVETFQPTRSFKIRGASNAIIRLKERGVRNLVTVSTGNHGQAVAHAARAHGMQATVFFPLFAGGSEQGGSRSRIGSRGSHRWRFAGPGGARGVACWRARRSGICPAFDDLDVVVGQATIGVEIVEELPGVAQVIIPVSGGGLFSGVAFAVKQCAPLARAVGVTMRAGAAMHTSLARGQPVLVDEVASLADSLGGGIGLENRYTFAMTRTLIDDFILVGEESIARAIAHAYRHERLVVEGAAAVGVAAPIAGAMREQVKKGPIVMVVTGGNIDMDRHLDV